MLYLSRFYFLATAYCLLATAYCLLATAYCLLPSQHRRLFKQSAFGEAFDAERPGVNQPRLAV